MVGYRYIGEIKKRKFLKSLLYTLLFSSAFFLGYFFKDIIGKL